MAADEQLKRINERQRRRAPDERHQQRMRSLYVDPDNSSWNRPVLSVTQEKAYNWINDLTNDYAGQRQKVEPELLKGHDERLLQELTEWSERPELPRPEWPRSIPCFETAPEEYATTSRVLSWRTAATWGTVTGIVVGILLALSLLLF